MTSARAIQLANKLSFSISLLIIHGILSDAEGDRAKHRLDKWAKKHGLKRRVKERP